MGLLYERTGRLTTKNGGFRPGQSSENIAVGDAPRLAAYLAVTILFTAFSALVAADNKVILTPPCTFR
jgi:hypothetical protein